MSDRRWFEAVVFGLAAHRATRLVTKDDITEKIRDGIVEKAYDRRAVRFAEVCGVVDHGQDALTVARAFSGSPPGEPEGGWSLFAEHDNDAPALATLVTCRWCASIWLTSGLLLVGFLFPKPARVLRYVLAGSSIAVLLARIEGD